MYNFKTWERGLAIGHTFEQACCDFGYDPAEWGYWKVTYVD